MHGLKHHLPGLTMEQRDQSGFTGGVVRSPHERLNLPLMSLFARQFGVADVRENRIAFGNLFLKVQGSTQLVRYNMTPVNSMDKPYTNVNINKLSGDQIQIPKSFASGMELLLKVAQSMIDPACVIKLCAGEHVVNKAVLNNEAWVIDNINSNELNVSVSKSIQESGAIKAFEMTDGDDVLLGSYTREFKKIGHVFDPDDKLPKMPYILHNVLKNVKPDAPTVRCWGVNFPAPAMELANCHQCASCTTVFGALLNNWCTDLSGFLCHECINYEARVTAVCSRCECNIRYNDNHPNIRPQITTRPDFSLHGNPTVAYSELWCAHCSVRYSSNFTAIYGT